MSVGNKLDALVTAHNYASFTVRSDVTADVLNLLFEDKRRYTHVTSP